MEDKSFTLKMGESEYCRDVTGELQDIVKTMGIENGHIYVLNEHTTCAFALNENESGLKKDFFDRMDRFAPRSQSEYAAGGLNYYRHDDSAVRTENLEPSGRERMNGHAHSKAMVMSPYLVLRIRIGKMHLGKWQRILFFDFDDMGEKRERTISISVI